MEQFGSRWNAKTEELWSLLLGLDYLSHLTLRCYIYIFALEHNSWPHPVIGVLMSAVEGLPEVPMQDVAVVCVIFASLCRGMSAQIRGLG